jgi:hypothetical protein
MNARVAGGMLGLLLATGLTVSAANDAPTLKSVLALAGSYLARVEHELARFVAEEHYVQEVVGSSSTSTERRELRSDLVFVGRLGQQRYVEYRDVFEVDGRAIRERAERLANLVVTVSDASMRQIVTDSARYNIGDIERTINVPLLPLMFLLPENQWRFKFKVQKAPPPPATSRDLPASPRFTVSTEVWAIEYREVERPTFIRFAGSLRDMPVRGRFWIEPTSGRVLMTELMTQDRAVNAAVNVSFQPDADLDLVVPVEMRETYWRADQPATVRGIATYSSFRRLGAR